MNHRTVFRLSPLTSRLRLVMSLQKFPPLSLLILFRRRKGEGFEQRGGGFSSGYENSDGMRDGFSGLREFSSAVDNGELDNWELVSSPHNGIDDGEHIYLSRSSCGYDQDGELDSLVRFIPDSRSNDKNGEQNSCG